MIYKRLWALPFVLTGFICCFSFIAGCAKKEYVSGKEEAIPVRVMKVKLKDMQSVLDYVGDIKAQNEVKIFPKVSGKIMEKLVQEGAKVNQQDVIAYIDRDEVGFKFEKAPVESPLAGIIGRLYVDIGTSVTPQTPVALVVDMDKVKVDLYIPEKYLSRLSLGQKAVISLDAYPDKEFYGQVSQIAPVLDLSTRAAPIEITIDNNEHLLKSGMFAKVKLILQEHKNVPVVLKEAIINPEDNPFVYVIENNRARQKKISVGLRQDEYFEVKEGIKENELAVIVGQQRLFENALVNFEEEK